MQQEFGAVVLCADAVVLCADADAVVLCADGRCFCVPKGTPFKAGRKAG